MGLLRCWNLGIGVEGKAEEVVVVEEVGSEIEAGEVVGEVVMLEAEAAALRLRLRVHRRARERTPGHVHGD